MNDEMNKIVETFNRNTLDRNKDVFAFANLINSIKGSRVISLESAWGSGKTFLLKQLQYIYDNQSNEQVKNKILKEKQVSNLDSNAMEKTKVFYYNAWKKDNSKYPVLSLMYGLIKDSGFNIDKKEIKAKFNANVINEKINTTGGELAKINPILSVLNELRKLVVLSEEKGDIYNLLANFISEKDEKELIKELFRKIKDEVKKEKIVIIVDELDRCKPDFALRLIEEIKHYFNIEGVIFILSMDINEMECIIKKYYGEAIDGKKYLDKIIEMHTFLNSDNIDKYVKELMHNMSEYGYQEIVDKFIQYNKMELREIIKYIQAIYDIIPNEISSNDNTESYLEDVYIKVVLNRVVWPILIGYIIIDSSKYKDMINGKAEKEFLDIIFYKDTDYISHYCKNLKYGDEKDIIEEKMRKFYHSCFDKRNKYAKDINEADLKNVVNYIIEMCKPLNSYNNLLSMK